MKDWILESTRMRGEGVTETSMKEEKEVEQPVVMGQQEGLQDWRKDEVRLSGVGDSQLQGL